VLVPVRWPLKVSQDLASLSYIAGGRVIAGMGLGFNPAELATVGMRIEDRIDILRETVEIARLIWKEDNVSYKGKIFSFQNVTIEPKPAAPIPIFCGGSTRAAIRRAAEYCDGWIPGRVPMATFDDRIHYLRQLTDRKITLGNIPITRIDKDRKKARASIDVEALAESSEGSSHWIKPPSGKFQTIEDLEGLLIVGNPEDCAAEIEKFRMRGVEHLVFDLRLQYGRFEESLELIGKELRTVDYDVCTRCFLKLELGRRIQRFESAFRQRAPSSLSICEVTCRSSGSIALSNTATGWPVRSSRYL